jgi:CubicO group peptidase (beta-lactamase class C family)
MEPLEALADWPIGAGAAALVGPAGVLAGAATVGGAGRRFAWASITKLCTALAVLVAVEERTLSLSDPAGPPGSTVAHLLAHASGLGPASEVMAPPGRRRIYSNGGYEVLADHLSARAGMASATYVRETVLDPIGMGDAVLGPGASAAHGMEGTIADLTALAREMLAPTVVSAATFARATSVAFAGLAGVLPGFGRQDPCDWGLGFELRGTKSPHWTGRHNSPRTFGHFGRAGGFVWADPRAGLALAVLTDTAFGPWATTAWPALADAVLDYHHQPI